MEDQRLLHILNEDPTAGMDLLKKRYTEFVRFAAAQRLDSDADIRDCVQDTFTDFYLKREQFDPKKGTLRGYLITIAERKAIQRWRENQRQRRMAQLFHPAPDDITAWERREFLEQALAQLPALDRQILHLRYYENRTAKEIAALLDTNHEVVQKRATRALKKLLRQLKE